MDKYAELREAVDVCQDGQIIQHKAERFIRVASPKTIAELLAERDAQAAEIERLREVLSSIQIFGLDTLSGRVDGVDDRAWQRKCVNEMTKRARIAL